MNISNQRIERKTPFHMPTIERMQLVSFLSVKVGILQIKINNGEIKDEVSLSLPEVFEEYLKNGTTYSELKAFEEDLKIALSVE